ncbi:MAG: PIN domain nuclease, partial [Chloroflexota bacterium]|nr:PIN domain nuclease [Chloroflexota bacterium]
MRLNLYFRIIGAVVLAWVGWRLSAPLWPEPFNPYRFIPAAAGLAVGAALAPLLTIEPFTSGRRLLRQTPASDLLAGVVGLLLAGVVSLILSFPLSQLPGYFGRLLPIGVFLLLAWLFVELSISRKDELLLAVGRRREAREGRGRDAQAQQPCILMDTSAIIDGRIADISQTGFIWGELVIPRFILQELQHIADSSDTLRRNRGRRGLDMLNKLQKESRVPIRIVDGDASAGEVDSKLVSVARQMRGAILTNDFNLNRVAELQGVSVLNVNELANALKPVVLPGEEMSVKIIQEGKEVGQGVGYLDDGTMIVVEGGKKH